jgi:L-threonylcarbamoyladenylate synthase
MKTQLITTKQLTKAVDALRKGEVIAFPTETVFGLGVIFDEEKAYQKLVEVKRRPPTQPFTLMCGRIEDIEKYAYLDEKTKKIVATFMPGPLTIIVRVKDDVPPFVTLGTGFIGIRVSESTMVQHLIQSVGKPLLVPSANKHGEIPATTSAMALEAFNGEIPFVIEGKSESNIPSTIIKIDGKIELIREGGIPFDRILEIVR